MKFRGLNPPGIDWARFGLSRNVSIFNLNQYITLVGLGYILDFNNNILYSTLVVYNPLQHPSGVHHAYTHHA